MLWSKKESGEKAVAGGKTPPGRLAASEIAAFVATAKRILWGPVEDRRSVEQQGVQVVPANFYSSVPTLDDIDASFEFAGEAPYASPRVFDPPTIAAYLGEIAGYAKDFTPPADGAIDAPAGFFWANGMFGNADAMTYWCTIRHLKPDVVLEVGSGFSTLVAVEAVRRNRRGRVIAVEPFPRPWLRDLGVELHETPVQRLDPGFFNERLTPGAILFIDSTHTVKAGSDCLHLYLRILPEIAHDVFVHVHDIALPYPMPRRRAYEDNIFWTEQYLLYAYLLENPRARVLYAGAYNARALAPAMTAMMDGKAAITGGSLWFHQRARADG